MAKKKKEEVIEEPIIVKVEEIHKKICRRCKTENEEDALYCKQCGSILKNKITTSNIFLTLSRIFKILSIVLAIDTLLLTRSHLGTARWDLIVIEYALILAWTLLLSSIFRLVGEDKSFIDLIKKKELFKDYQTFTELKLILLIIFCALILLGYTNSRIMYIKPGNMYVERKVKNYAKRWGTVEYTRAGVRKCTDKKMYFDKIEGKVINCYEYTYRIEFKDGQSCFIKYRTRYDYKRNEEIFSYCAKK